MIRIRLAVAVLALALSACSGQVPGMMSVPAAHMRGITNGVRAMPSNGVRAMPGNGVRAMPADGETDAQNAASSDQQDQSVNAEGLNPTEFHSPTLP